MKFEFENTVNEQINIPKEKGIELFVKREDELHAFVSGNKYRKLKYNLLQQYDLKTRLQRSTTFCNQIFQLAEDYI